MHKLGYFFIGIFIILFTTVFFGWNYIPYWISNALSQKMGVSVTIGHLNLKPNTTTIRKLIVGNPKGFNLKNALKIEEIQANAPFSSFFYDHIVIDKMLLSNLYLGLEFESATDTTGNWTVIMNNLQSSLGNSTSSSKEEKTFLIKLLAVDNIRISLFFKKGSAKVKHLKPIAHMEFKNVSSEGDFPMGQLTNVIMSEILKEIFIEQGLKNMLQDTIKSPQDVYDSIKSLFSLRDPEPSSNETVLTEKKL